MFLSVLLMRCFNIELNDGALNLLKSVNSGDAPASEKVKSIRWNKARRSPWPMAIKELEDFDM